MKKMICILAAVSLTFSAMPASACALNTVSDGYETEILPVTEFQYETNEDGVTITGYTGSAADLVIPEVLDGKAVTEIGDKALWDVTAETLTVPRSVVRLGTDSLPENGTLIKASKGSAAGDYLFGRFCKGSFPADLQFTYYDLTDIADASVDFPGMCSGRPPLHFEYDGTDHKEFFYDRLFNGTVCLKEGTDYTVSYTDTENVGEGYKAFTGTGNYTGVFYDRITITPAQIKNAVFVYNNRWVYTGKAIKPEVGVRFMGMNVTNDTTVSYKNNKNCGKAIITITGKGNFTGKVNKSFIIVPKKATIAKKKALGKGKIKVWVKKDKQASGYQIQLSTSKKFTKKTTVSANVKSPAKTFAKLKKGKVYYIRARSFVTVSKKNRFGKYSKVTKIKCR